MAKTTTGTVVPAPSEHKSGGMPQLNTQDWAPQLVWLALTFTVFYLIMSRVALPRIGNVIEERRNRIATDLDKADEYKSMTEQAIAGYEQALAEARAKANTIGQDTRQRINEEVDREREEVDRQLAETADAADARIRASKDAALAQVNVVAGATAEEIVSSLIGASISEAERNAAVSSSLKQG